MQGVTRGCDTRYPHGGLKCLFLLGLGQAGLISCRAYHSLAVVLSLTGRQRALKLRFMWTLPHSTRRGRSLEPRTGDLP